MVLATEEGLARLGVRRRTAWRLAGFGQATDPLKKEGRDVLHRRRNAAMKRAYRRRRLPRRRERRRGARLLQRHGGHRYRGVGTAGAGQGARYWLDGKAPVDGDCGINTSGGLIAKGHPIGATGVAMIGWCAWQLLGKVPAALQVKAPRARGDVQHRWARSALRLHGAEARAEPRRPDSGS